MKKITAILFLISLNLSAAVVNWTGNGNGVSWEDVNNWSGLTLPTSGDEVNISADSVSISSSVSIKKLLLTNATLVLSTNATAFLQISFSSSSIGLQLINSKCILNRNLSIYNHVQAIEISSNSELTLKVGATLLVQNIIGTLISNSGLLKVENGATLNLISFGGNCIFNSNQFVNFGKVFLTGNGTGDSGIISDELSSIINHGLLDIKVCTFSIANFSVGVFTFTNALTGTLDIDGKITSEGNFINNGTFISKNNSGILIKCLDNSVFYNSGSMVLNYSDDHVITMTGSAEFINDYSGTISIQPTTNPNFLPSKYILNSQGRIFNYGNLDFELDSKMGGIQSGGEFYNDGTIKISNPTISCMGLGGVFVNNLGAKIEFDKNQSDQTVFSAEGLVNGSTFENLGEIELKGTLKKGLITVSSGIFNNYNSLIIKPSVKVALVTSNQSNFENKPCAFLQLASEVTLSSTINLHNNGIIYDENQHIDLRFGITNNGLYYSNFQRENTSIQKELLPILSTVSHTFSSSLYRSPQLTSNTIMGTLIKRDPTASTFFNSIEWTPNSQASNFSSYFFQMNDGAGCTKVLRIERIKTPTCTNENLSNSMTNTFVGTFDNDWHKNENWNKLLVPNRCHKVIIPNGKNAFLENDIKAEANLIDIRAGAIFDTDYGAVLSILNEY